MTGSPWPSEWLRGSLALAVMRVLRDGEAYGYMLSSRLEEAGFGAIKGGTLYPLLSRLEAAGLVEARWEPGEGGPGRKYFTLSPDGHRDFEERRTNWSSFADLMATFLED
ncbi:PadR family transcriptional regulator [Falsarthrobacter nasiphocae]|uniref:PadR family transcriptional regulator PadR n=1 Tax=Falsarthrobacter nasiphocae TaxID=189863 RepID=A0AAE3YFY5_9MICC|nr:PadR family transcriptional regulator [Falsarthrobacter nasiphocae]MDR6891522.1 PadR family transcriptional regulator PadR [Falsarthrobacter nasiphocae]